MYQEKAIANFIVALLCGQTLNKSELSDVKAFCNTGFDTPNALVGVVRNMIAGADVSLNDPDFRAAVKGFVLSYIVSEDEELSKTLRMAKRILRVHEIEQELDALFDELESINNDVEHEQEPKIEHNVFYSIVGDKMVITEGVSKDGELKNTDNIVVPIKKGYRFLEYAKKRGADIELI